MKNFPSVVSPSAVRKRDAALAGRADLRRTNVLENEITFQFQRLEPIAIDVGCLSCAIGMTSPHDKPICIHAGAFSPTFPSLLE